MKRIIICVTFSLSPLFSQALHCVDAFGVPMTSIGLHWDLSDTRVALENFNSRDNNNFRTMELQWMPLGELLQRARMTQETVNIRYVQEDMNALYLGKSYLDYIDTPALTAVLWADQDHFAITSNAQAKALYELYRQGLISEEEIIPVVIQSMPTPGKDEPIQPQWPLAETTYFQESPSGERVAPFGPFPRISL